MDTKFEMTEDIEVAKAAYCSLLPHHVPLVENGKIDWKFSDNPSGRGKIVLCRTQDNKVVGMNSFMAVQFEGRRMGRQTGYQSMDTIVDLSMRGKGIFPKLQDHFNRLQHEGLVYGFPNVNSAPGFFGKLSWHRYSAVPMLVKPLRTGIFSKFLKKVPDWPLPAITKRSDKVVRVENFDVETTRCWKAFVETNAIGIAASRTHEHLNWRFRDHPVNKYQLYAHTGKAYGAATMGAKHGTQVGYIAEAFGERDCLPHVILSMTDSLKQNGATVAFAWCYKHSSNYTSYLKAGFLPFPEKFRPIEINFGARLFSENLKADQLRAENWYLSYFDSDTV